MSPRVKRALACIRSNSCENLEGAAKDHMPALSSLVGNVSMKRCGKWLLFCSFTSP